MTLMQTIAKTLYKEWEYMENNKMEEKNLNEVEVNEIKEEGNWWTTFVEEESGNPVFEEIFSLIDKAAKSKEEDELIAVRPLVAELDKDKYSEEIKKFNQRISVLQKRVDRKLNSEFSVLLKTLRTNKKLTLAKLSDMTGISASYLNRLELGDRSTPSISILNTLSEVLDFPISSSLQTANTSGDGRVPTVEQLLYANAFKFSKDDEKLDIGSKEKLIDLVKFVLEMEWGDNKHVETLELFNLIEELKKVQKTISKQ